MDYVTACERAIHRQNWGSVLGQAQRPLERTMSCLRLRNFIMIASIPMICRDYGHAHKPACRLMQARESVAVPGLAGRLYVAHPERLAVLRGFQPVRLDIPKPLG